jgi:hypothetical protein
MHVNYRRLLSRTFTNEDCSSLLYCWKMKRFLLFRCACVDWYFEEYRRRIDATKGVESKLNNIILLNWLHGCDCTKLKGLLSWTGMCYVIASCVWVWCKGNHCQRRSNPHLDKHLCKQGKCYWQLLLFKTLSHLKTCITTFAIVERLVFGAWRNWSGVTWSCGGSSSSAQKSRMQIRRKLYLHRGMRRHRCFLDIVWDWKVCIVGLCRFVFHLDFSLCTLLLYSWLKFESICKNDTFPI